MSRTRRDRRHSKKRPFITGSIIAIVVLSCLVTILLVVSQNKEVLKEKPQEVVKETPTKQPVVEQPAATKKVDAGGYAVSVEPVTEPTYVKGVLIANKKYPLPKMFNKGEQPVAKAALDKMIAGAKKSGINLVAFSGFRSYEYQETLYNKYVARDGQQAADRYSARPGYSEHQTGLAYDIGEVGREDLWLTAEFGNTEAGQWLVNHAHEYGFILRYPQGKEQLTGFMYESWHFRYLGKDLATEVKNANVTLEEFLGIQ